MLRKLLKYDFRELWRSTLPLFVSMIVIGACGCGFIFFSDSVGSEAPILFIFTQSLIIFGAIAILAMYFIVWYLSIARYYRALFSEEGYLNMVIPVKTGKLLLSKYIVVFVWNIINSLLAIASLSLIILLPNLLNENDFIMMIFNGVLDVTALDVIMYVISTLSLMAASILTIFTSITIGSTLFKNRRFPASVLFAFMVYFVNLMLDTSIHDIIFNTVSGDTLEAEFSAIAIACEIVSISLLLITCIVLYFINLHIVKKKFNLT